MPELVFYQKGDALFRFPLAGAFTQIGRSPECDVTLAGESVSRVQLAIYESEGAYLIKNVGKLSAQLNGQNLDSAPLKEGDRVHLAEWEIVFVKGEKPGWSDDETYVSKAAGSGTQLINATFSQGKYLADQICLKIHEPQKDPRTFLVAQEVTTVGKGSNCDLVLNDPFCSDTHGKLIVKGNRVVFFDLNSTNGSFVNGVKIKEAELEEDQQIRLGKTEISLEMVSEAQPVKPLPVDSFGPIVGKSNAMRDLYNLIQQVAPTDATVCVLGETGTGKELVARSLHDLSPRHLKPFVALNCGAISRELIESELFGHEKGAFTGAHQQRKGAFEQAQGGTLFLDEIGELPLDLQPTLLRVLETGKIRRVGGQQEISVDVRVVCATHREMADWVKQGKFREDLFFRLYVFPLFLPPLRERREDILLIVQYFLKTLSPPKKKFRLNPAAARHFETQEWRGNVRELKNVIQRAIIMAKDNEIGVKEVGAGITPPSMGANLGAERAGGPPPLPNTANLEDLQKEIILRELRAHDGNRKAAAKALGIAKSTLYERLRQYGIK